MGHSTLNRAPLGSLRRVYYGGSNTLGPGQLVSYDYTNATLARRATYVTDPTFNNIGYRHMAGVVMGAPAGAGPYEIDVLPLQGIPLPGVNVWTNENVAVGDVLGPVPGTNICGRGVVFPCFIATEAQDRSGTAGMVQCTYFPLAWDQVPQDKMRRHFDHFGAPNVAGTLATQLPNQTYLLKGTASFSEAATEDVPVGLGIGELTLRAAATTIVSIQQPGAQWLLSTGRSLLCRMRVKIDDISDEDFCVGLFTAPTNNGSGVVTPADLMTAAAPPVFPADYICFAVDGSVAAGLLNFQSQVTSGGSTVSTGISMVNDTYIDLAFLVKNRVAGAAAGAKTIQVFVNGTQTNNLTTAAWAADVPTVLGQAWGMGVINGTPTCTIDRLEIVQNL